ncbi:MAG: hypothetical protein AB1595_03160 [bacterium]
MKRGLLIFLIGLGFGERGLFAKCPACPEKVIKREVPALTYKKKEATYKKKKATDKKRQRKTKREEPPISFAKSPFPIPLRF